MKEGDTVKQGATIADMGTGPSGTPSLHFEVRKSGPRRRSNAAARRVGWLSLIRAAREPKVEKIIIAALAAASLRALFSGCDQQQSEEALNKLKSVFNAGEAG